MTEAINLFENAVNTDRINQMSLSELNAVAKILGIKERKLPTEQELLDLYREVSREFDECPTWHLYFKKAINWWDEKNDLAIVMAWEDYGNEPCLMGKVATLKSNTICADYYDWIDIGCTEMELEDEGDVLFLYQKAKEALCEI